MANGQAYFAHRYGPWAVVTGASSGIGAELARQLAGRGCNLLLVARRLERLRQLAEELKHQHGVETDTLALDLARSDFLESLLDASDRRDVGLVVCNAGLGAKGLHHETARAQIESVLSVNCRAVTLMAGAFLPKLIDRGRGGLLLTGSIEAAVGFPYSATYSASKAYVRAFGEALWSEARPAGVDVLVLAPGATDTEILPAQGIRPDKMTGLMSPQVVARGALEHLGKGPHYIPGVHNKAMVAVLGLLPRRLAVALAGKGMRSAIAGSASD